MSELRRDIAEAAARMVVTFGTRSAMRDLAEELGAEEQVVELAACTYAGAAGLVALTTERVIAIRDDYSKHQVQFVLIREVATVDYDPTVHDGFALFSSSGRLVVRKMRREDGDRLVDALLTRAPHIVVHVTRPGGGAANAQERLGRHRKPASIRPGDSGRAQPRAVPGATPDPLVAPKLPPAIAAQANAAQAASQAVNPQPNPAAAGEPGHQAGAAGAGAVTAGIPTVPPVGPPGSTPGVGGAAAPTATASQATMPAPGLAQGAAGRPATDKEILLGVLADLHAQGVLTAEEFAAKVRQIVNQP
ncbi:SHOCT domain-containing protein [Austwickia chelonae]|uniref:SHOCT domain-containing protein n=1 Tax=Austwickia chelonae TaxID=100225 RepID=UPI0013C32F64|nr:SHOCT domain-containing protein [Austwickia chelonae]